MLKPRLHSPTQRASTPDTGYRHQKGRSASPGSCHSENLPRKIAKFQSPRREPPPTQPQIVHQAAWNAMGCWGRANASGDLLLSEIVFECFGVRRDRYCPAPIDEVNLVTLRQFSQRGADPSNLIAFGQARQTEAANLPVGIGDSPHHKMEADGPSKALRNYSGRSLETDAIELLLCRHDAPEVVQTKRRFGQRIGDPFSDVDFLEPLTFFL